MSTEEIEKRANDMLEDIPFIPNNVYCNLLDYITNLQDRIKELEQINEEHRKINGELRKTINEAIEYIKNKTKNEVTFDNDKLIDVLNILQGSEDK